jgi:hypothetical protein
MLAFAFLGFIGAVAAGVLAYALGPAWLQGLVLVAVGCFVVWGRDAFAQIGIGHYSPSLRPGISQYAAAIGIVLVAIGCATVVASLF